MSATLKTTMLSKERFCDLLLQYNEKTNTQLVEDAYTFAKRAHSGQKRISGEPYFTHVFAVALILAKWRMDTNTICAGLLHDVLEDTAVKSKEIEERFGSDILTLIEGVTKLDKMPFGQEKELRAENVRKVLFASMKNMQIIFIKLADRLHNMRTVHYLDREKQERIAQETLDIYVSIAYKMGMYVVKSEMEDLALKVLDRKAYAEIKQGLTKKKQERERVVELAIKKMKDLLMENQIRGKVKGRVKNFYGIYDKMKRKKLILEQVRDLYGLRIIVNSVDDCYRVLTLIHSRWRPITQQFDDYIKVPKPNMYRSLHTEIDMDGYTIETQIRTEEMHHTAEEGLAAHWRYKRTEQDKKFDRRVGWIKQILEWTTTSPNAKEFIEELKVDLFKDEIYVLTPKGDPIPLREGATPIDFAYRVHTNIGNHCLHARVNDVVVPLHTQLKPGDVCEIITAKNASPSRNWINIAKTQTARAKIREALHLKMEKKMEWKQQPFAKRLHPLELIKTAKTKLLSISRCCKWYEGDAIIGYRAKDNKIKVHEKKCKMVRTFAPERIIDLDWQRATKKERMAVRIEIKDRLGLFSDILDLFSSLNVKVTAINAKRAEKKTFVFFEIENREKINEVVSRIKEIKNVLAAEKVTFPA